MTELEVPQIKICGVTSLADARIVVEAGADALGLIYASSVRQVVGDAAFDVVARYSHEIWCVGVFRNQEDHEIVRIVERDGLRAVQLHDEAGEDLLDALAARKAKVIRAVTLDSPTLNNREQQDVVAVIVDGARPGSGVPNDWVAVASLHFEAPMLIAGGLSAENVADAISVTSPWGVDVASGVEAAHGVKDRAKVASFVTRAREALPQKGAQ